MKKILSIVTAAMICTSLIAQPSGRCGTDEIIAELEAIQITAENVLKATSQKMRYKIVHIEHPTDAPIVIDLVVTDLFELYKYQNDPDRVDIMVYSDQQRYNNYLNENFIGQTLRLTLDWDEVVELTGTYQQTKDLLDSLEESVIDFAPERSDFHELFDVVTAYSRNPKSLQLFVEKINDLHEVPYQG